MRLTLVISSLSSGGAERVLTVLANEWASQGWEVTLIALAAADSTPFYRLSDAVKYVPVGIAGPSLNTAAAIRNNWHRVRVLRRVIEATHPEAVLAFMEKTNILTLLATIGRDYPTLVSERTPPDQYAIGRAWNLLRRLTYPRAAALIVQTRSVTSFFSPRLQSRVRVIPNPVVTPTHSVLQPGRRGAKRPHRLVAVGRLEKEKGFDLLLEAFARTRPVNDDWILTIWGEGKQRAALQSLCVRLGIEGKVQFPGRTHDIHQRLSEADMFVMSSRFEGFPNALCEAMACGLPVISFDCPRGPREIIRHGVDGILVPNGDVQCLSTSIGQLMENETERARLALMAPEILKRFGVQKVLHLWQDLLSEVCAQPAKRRNG